MITPVVMRGRRNPYPSIPDPIAHVESLVECVRSLKQVVEMMAQQRGPLLNSSPTFQDLVNIGVITVDLTLPEPPEPEPVPARPSFIADKNGVNQTGVLSAVTTKLTFDNVVHNEGGLYDGASSRWTPLEGVVHLIGVVGFASTNIVDQADYQCFVYKNGVAHRRGPAVRASGSALSLGTIVSILDYANGTDYYEIWVNAGGAGGDKTVQGNVLNTYFMGYNFGS